jgi:putative tricarboxylic transport membrane protein
VTADPVRVDRLLGGVLVCFGLGVLALAVWLPATTAADPVGPRGFPVLLALVIVACGVALGVAPERPSSAGGAPDGEAEERGALAPRPLLGAIALTAAYLAVLEPAGYLLATPPYLAALLLVQGRVTPRAFVLTVLGLPVALYVLFAVVMRVPLPPGPLEPLLGKQDLHLRRRALEDVAVHLLEQGGKEAHELPLFRLRAVPPVGAEGLLGHLPKCELGTHDLSYFLHSLLMVVVPLQSGILEHQDKPLDSGVERGPRRLGGSEAQV